MVQKSKAQAQRRHVQGNSAPTAGSMQIPVQPQQSTNLFVQIQVLCDDMSTSLDSHSTGLFCSIRL